MKSLDWGEDTTLSDAISYLRTITGLNVYATPRATAAKEDLRLPFTIDDVAVTALLDLMTGPNGLSWEVRDGIVRIGLADEVAGLLLRYYDVNDLADDPPRFSDDAPAPAPPAHTTTDAPSPQPLSKVKMLLTTVRALIDPEAWTRAGASAECRKGVLIVRAPAATHAKVEGYLGELRRAAT